MKSVAIPLLSGGQDSVTCAAWAKGTLEATEIAPVCFDYGQKHAIEMQCAQVAADFLEIPRPVVLPVAMPDASALTEHSEDVGAAHPVRDDLPATFTAGRNILFLTLAASWAFGKFPGHRIELVTGVCQTDYSGYPDCRDSFIRSMSVSLSLGLDVPVAVHTPLMWKTKAETFALAGSLGVLETVLEHSHTCYNGDHSTRHDWGYGCGECPACVLRQKGWEEYVAG